MVQNSGPTHPRELEAHFGRERVINAWGGYSQATKRALEKLHRRGHLRIARRDKGIRVYEAMPPLTEPMSPDDRFRKLVLMIANLHAPVLEKTLLVFASKLKYLVPGIAARRTQQAS